MWKEWQMDKLKLIRLALLRRSHNHLTKRLLWSIAAAAATVWVDGSIRDGERLTEKASLGWIKFHHHG